MPTKKTGDEPRAPEELRRALIAAPLEEFVALRARMAAELKAKGQREIAQAVLALRKPSAVEWGCSQLEQREPERLGSLRTARDAAERAQSAGDPSRLRAAIGEYRAE